MSILGVRNGNLFAIGWYQPGDQEPSYLKVILECDCGKIIVASSEEFYYRRIEHCGCGGGKKPEFRGKDLTGTVFGVWTVTGYAEQHGANRFWYAKCQCGFERKISYVQLKYKTPECNHLNKPIVEPPLGRNTKIKLMQNEMNRIHTYRLRRKEKLKA